MPEVSDLFTMSVSSESRSSRNSRNRGVGRESSSQVLGAEDIITFRSVSWVTGRKKVRHAPVKDLLGKGDVEEVKCSIWYQLSKFINAC